jgi:NAD(P)H-quinone oxidoreductase subunit 2
MNDQLLPYTTALQYMGPEICLVVAIVFATLWNLFSPRQSSWTPQVAIAMLVLASLMLVGQFSLPQAVALFPTGSNVNGLFTVDKLTVVFGFISCMIGIICVFMSMGYDWRFGTNKGEFYAVLLTAVLAVLLLSGTTDLIMLFVGLETLTICCVVLSGFNKKDRKSNEASLKYLLSTAATTATFLYGLSFLYGMTGFTNYYEIAASLQTATTQPSLLLILLIVLLLSVVGFKVSMVPFHMWTPDVYEGAPTPVTAFLSVGSKLGGFVVAIRLLSLVFGSAHADWMPIVSVLAMLSMIIGNLVALAQTSLKRMLAYSSIAHVGYLLIGLAAATRESTAAMIFYLIVYAFMNLGAFTAAILIENEIGTDNIDDLAGLLRKRPWVAIGLSLCLLNLAGLPVPPAGFLAKVFIFWSGFQMNTYFGTLLVIVALITSVPAVYYYTRVVIMMVVKEPSDRIAALPDRRPRTARPQMATALALVIAIIGITVGTVAVNPLMSFSTNASSVVGSVKPAVSVLPDKHEEVR